MNTLTPLVCGQHVPIHRPSISLSEHYLQHQEGEEWESPTPLYVSSLIRKKWSKFIGTDVAKNFMNQRGFLLCVPIYFGNNLPPVYLQQQLYIDGMQ